MAAKFWQLHEHVPAPRGDHELRLACVSGHYQYCHYLWDGTDDRGWGCGYRTLQTIISWIIHNTSDKKQQLSVPSLPEIQKILVEVVKRISLFHVT